MRFVVVAAFALSVLATPAIAAPCKDAKGKFIKCPPPAAAPMAAKRCKDTKGKFTKCTMAGARPV